jgi:hypothetical protein
MTRSSKARGAPIALAACAGLFGPLLAAVPRAPLGPVDTLLRPLVILLWPAQFMGALEYSLGRHTAFAVLAAMNVALFAVLGVAVRIWTVAVTTVILGALVCWDFFLAGWDPAFINWSALALAMAFYGALPLSRQCGLRRIRPDLRGN